MARRHFFRFLRLCLFALLLPGCSSDHRGHAATETGAAIPVDEARPGQTLQPHQLEEDFAIFRNILEDAHPGLYWHHSKNDIDRYFEEVERRLHRPLSEIAFYRMLLNIISNIGCGHTWVNASEPLESTLWSKVGDLPIELAIVDNTLFSLTSYGSSPHVIREGDRILSINGHPATSLIEDFLEYAVGDGHIASGRLRMIERRFNFYYRLLHGQADRYHVTYANRDAAESSVDMPAMTSTDVERTARRVDATSADEGNITYRPYHNARTAYLKIASFSDWVSDGKELQFEDELARTFERIDDTGATDLIIDLRDNRGGADALGLRTLSYLLDHPIVEFEQMYFKSIDPPHRQYTDLDNDVIEKLSAATRHLNDTTFAVIDEVAIQPFGPSRPNFSGNVFVLMNGNTFSTATDVAAILHSRQRATFVGEETGGGYYGNSSGYFTTVTLPRSRFRVRLPLVGYQTNVEERVPRGRGVLPDHDVSPGIQDLVTGEDVEMAFTLDLIDIRR